MVQNVRFEHERSRTAHVYAGRSGKPLAEARSSDRGGKQVYLPKGTLPVMVCPTVW